MLALLILMLTYFWLILGGLELFKFLNRQWQQHRVHLLYLGRTRIKHGAVLHSHR